MCAQQALLDLLVGVTPAPEYHEYFGGFVAAAYQHRTSRSQDPHLHTHVIVANMAQTPSDGKWRALALHRKRHGLNLVVDSGRWTFRVRARPPFARPGPWRSVRLRLV